MKLQCKCGQPIEINDESQGQSFNCPSCQTTLTIPFVKQKSAKWQLPTIIVMSVALLFTGFYSYKYYTIYNGLKQMANALGVTADDSSSDDSKKENVTPNVESSNGWKIDYTKDEMDDSKGYILSTQSKTPIHGMLGKEYPTFIIKYSKSDYTVGIVFDNMLEFTINSEIGLTYRLDSNKAIVDNWRFGTTKKNFIYYQHDETDFIKNMCNNKTLIIQIDTESGRKVMTFDVSGLQNDLIQIQNKIK